MKLYNPSEITLRFFLKSLVQQTDLSLISIVHDILSGQDKTQAEALQKLEAMTNTSSENSNAQFLLGFCYEQPGTTQDYSKALKCYESAQSKNLYAQWRIGILHERGNGVEKNEKTAFEWYQKAAAHGLAEAQHSLGNRYEEGLGVEKDEKKAFELYLQSAKQGLAHAQNDLGRCYVTGLGVEKNEKIAVEWFQAAAKQEHGAAQSNLGLLYERGNGGEKNEKCAFEWYQKSANHYNDQGQKNLDRMYENGWGLETGKEKDLEWYKSSALGGYSFAQCLLGVAYAEGLYGIEKDLQVAQQYFDEAEQRRNGVASYVLSVYEDFPDDSYPNMPLLWRAVHFNPLLSCEVLPKLFRMTTEKLTVSPSEGPLKGVTILSLLISHEDSNSEVILQLLEILKRYPLEERKLDAPVANEGDNKEWTALHFAAYDRRTQIVASLLNLGASLDKGPQFNSILTEIEDLKIRKLLQAANDIFTLVEGREGSSVETKRSAETKEKDEVTFAAKLKESLKILGEEGVGVNARKKGLTALDMALEKEDCQAIEILLTHGAEFPQAKSSDSTIVKAIRTLLEIQQKIATFQVQIDKYESEEKAKERDEGKLKQLQETLNVAGKEILALGNKILDLSHNLGEPSKSQVCYKLGTLLHHCQPHFKEMVFESLSQVVHDKVQRKEFEQANFILFHLKLETEKIGIMGLENNSSDILSFAIKAGKQLPPKVLAYQLSSKVLGVEGLKDPLGLSDKDKPITRAEALIAAFREHKKLHPGKKGGGGASKLGLR